MTEYLKHKLAQLSSNKENQVDYEGLAVTFEVNPPATENDISLLGNELIVPADYMDFLKIYNGCTLYQFEDLGGFRFLGTKEINNETVHQKETYGDDWDQSLSVFCQLIADGDFISFRNKGNNEYEIVDCYHDEIPKNWVVIGNSFDDFLIRLIDEKGKRFWL